MMSVRRKSFLLAVPVAIAMQSLLIFFGIWLFGDRLNFALMNVFGVGCGLVAFFSIKSHLMKKQKPESD